MFQGMIEKTMTIEQPVDTTYSDKEILDIQLILENNYYTNLKSLHLRFPIRFRKLLNAAHNLDADIYPVNNFFAHWLRETDIRKYGTNKSLIPTTTPNKIYRYSDSMLKYLPKNAQKMIPGNEDRRSHNNDNETTRTDANTENREYRFAGQIDSKYVYRIPLKYLCDLGKINFPAKIDPKFSARRRPL